jgi:addiction module HigA family antidote
MKTQKNIPLIHPGETLLEDFLIPMEITRYRLAKSIGVPQRRIDEICAGKRAISADTALRLARFFGTDSQSWLNLQSRYDLEVASQLLAERLDRDIIPFKLAA